MKHRLLMVFIIISLFILSALATVLYLKKSSDAGTSAKNPVSETTVVDADTAGQEPEETATSKETANSEDTSDTEDTEEPEGSDESEDTEDAPAEPEEENDETGDTFDGDDTRENGADTAQMQPTLPKFDELLQVNPYVSGWLTIDGSPINDPVVYTPGSQNYFLHRDIYGGNNSTGTLFIAVNWQNGFNNTLIYGHNMKDGTGFGALSKFANSSYGANHNVIHFDTLYEEKDYQLLGVFYSQIEEDELETEEDRADKDNTIAAAAIAKKEAEAAADAEEGQEMPEIHIDPQQLTLFDIDLHRDFGDEDIYREEKNDDRGRFRYYYYTDLANKDDFDYYVRNVKERALYDTGVDAQWGDELITLSTCSYQVKNGRFVVVGVRKK